MTATARLVDRLARRLDRGPDDHGRRSFLARAAVAGAALATNPLTYLLRPGTAHAAVCGDGAGCGTGWTVFCCTVNGGANTCPDGTFAAGWWKADGSAFCGGAARYYIDCNRLPSQPGACSCVGCHSGNGTCDQRRYCCNVFRYGQCHLEIPGVTPVVCRVITCTPPWQWDPACGTSARTDNRTGSHTAPCLPGAGAGAIAVKYQDLGLVGSELGRQVGDERDAPGGGRWVAFEDGAIHWRSDLGAWGTWGAFHEHWFDDRGGPGGPLGYPVSDTGATSQRFERATLFASDDTGVHAVQGAILDAYGAAGGPTTLGYPVADEEPGPDGGTQSRFERATITWRDDLGAHAVFGAIHERWVDVGPESIGVPWQDAFAVAGRGFEQGFTRGGAIFWASDLGAFEVREPILTRYRRAGGPTGGMGWPVASPVDAGGAQLSRFERGTIASHRRYGTRAIFGAVHERWLDADLGLPTSDEVAVGDGRGRSQAFVDGTIWWTPDLGAHDVVGPLLAAYLEQGGPGGPLGYPVADTERPGGGRLRSRFEHGTLVADADGNVNGG